MSIQQARPIFTDEYIVEEDEMGDSGAQDFLIHYLKEVLLWLYRQPQWMIAANRNHYHAAVNNSQKLIVPDISVFKGIPIPPEQQPYIVSWDMRLPGHPPPPVVIEIASRTTYHGDIDLDKKPRLYGLIGVREYFTYDPNTPRVWPSHMKSRLIGWRYDENGVRTQILPEVAEGREGWLWSEVLEHWLVPDGLHLRLYDRYGQRALTGTEAGDLARQQAEQQAKQAEQDRLQAEQQAKQAEQDRLQAEQQAKQAEQDRVLAQEQTQQEIAARQEMERVRRAEQEQAARQIAELQRQLDELRRRPE